MAFSKSHAYPLALQQTANYMKALGHPERLAIIYLLQKHGTQCVTEIAKHSPLYFTSVSQHLAILRRYKIVSCSEQYPFTFYTVNVEELQQAKQILDKYFESLKATETKNLIEHLNH